MAPDAFTTTDLSASARAELSGIMVVDSVIAAPGKPKTLYIVGGFSSSTTLMGAFKYFNRYDYVFQPQSRWVVHTTVRLCFIFAYCS